MYQVFFSLDQSNSKKTVTEYNVIRRALSAYKVTSRLVIGCYTYGNGEQSLETTIRAMHVSTQALEHIKSLARFYKQESILVIDKLNNAYLIYLAENRTVKAGTFKQVSNPIGLNAYTYDAREQKYYSAG